jgi:hypothetical protein
LVQQSDAGTEASLRRRLEGRPYGLGKGKGVRLEDVPKTFPTGGKL